MKKLMENHLFIKDMIASLSCELDPDTAKRGIRTLCRYFGGQLLYIPANKDDGIAAEKIRGVLSDEVGDGDAEKIIAKLMLFYGGIQLYVPLERTGFKGDIAREIYEKYDGTPESMNELCREYNVTFTQIYRSVHSVMEMKRQERIRKTQMELFPAEKTNNHG